MAKTKPATVQQLKNWFVLDSILFDGDSKKHLKSNSLFSEYVTLKSSFLLNLNEFYQHTKIEPVNVQYENSQIMQDSAQEYAKKCKAVASVLMTKNDMGKQIAQKVMSESKRVKDSNINRVADIVVEHRFKRFAMDNAFVGLPLLENKMELIPNDFHSSILFEAYKMQRNALIKFAMRHCV